MFNTRTTILLLRLALLVRWIDWLADMMHVLILQVVTNSQQRKQHPTDPTPHIMIVFQQTNFRNDRSGLMRLKIILIGGVLTNSYSVN